MVSHIRFAEKKDVPAMLAIYRPYVEKSTVSFELEAPTEAEMCRRLESIQGKLPWLVLECEGEVAGYAYASPFMARKAYAWSVSGSVYVSPSHQKQGVARRLYAVLETLLRAQGYCTLYGLISLPNEASEGFHRSMGFHRQAVLPEVGYKMDHFVDVTYYAKKLEPQRRPPEMPLPLDELPLKTIQDILTIP